MNVSDLEVQSKIADAELSVAEELSWPLAVLAGLVVFHQADSWVLALLAGAAAYWLATVRYRRRAAAAEDAYFRSAKLGKYVEPPARDHKTS